MTRRRRIAAAIALAVMGGAAALGVGAWRFVDGLGPLDLGATRERSPIVLARDGTLLRPFVTKDGRWRLPVSAVDVDPRMLAVLRAYEDSRFDDHRGVDLMALARAAAQAAWNGRVVSGASTLTMQVARLMEPRDERTLAAKARQMVRALQLERALSKDEILALYLTLAPYGGNIEGIRAASFAYFGREPKRLSHAEAALLVALPQAPELRRPDRFPDAARRARARVLARAEAAGLLSAAERAAAGAEPVPTARSAFPMLAAHAAESALAERPDERIQRLTIDARIQSALQHLARERGDRLGPRQNLAILVIDNASNEIRAQIGAARYLDAERLGAIDMTRALRSPGSTLKPFVYALAFETGLAHPETLLDDRPSRHGAYAPDNFDLTFQGTVTARRALQHSLNVPAVELLADLGPPRFLARLRQAGAEIVIPGDAPPGLAVGLGGLGVTLADLAKLYAGLARGGETAPLQRRAGEPAEAPGGSIADPVAAWYVADILKGAPPPDNALANRIAFKTGTSYGFRDAFAVGFDRRFTVAVWVGRPDGAPVPGMTGRGAAAPILFDAFSRIGGEPEAIPAPPHALLATTATLPPPLRHIRKDAPKTIAATVASPLRIAFPPEGARVDLGLSGASVDLGQLALKAQGGVAPLIWLVNGAPLTSGRHRRETFWRPDGAGFARVSVIDATGATDSVTVRLE
jgi:penicillin-binding protein 1C